MKVIQPDLYECARCRGITREGVIICSPCVRELEETRKHG